MGEATGRDPGRALITSGAVARRFRSAGLARPLATAAPIAWCGWAGPAAEGGEMLPSFTACSLGVKGPEIPLVTSPADTRRMRLAATTADPTPFKEGRPGALPGRGTRCGGLACPLVTSPEDTRRARAAGGALAGLLLPGVANSDGAGDSRWWAYGEGTSVSSSACSTSSPRSQPMTASPRARASSTSCAAAAELSACMSSTSSFQTLESEPSWSGLGLGLGLG
eukprot:scaffold88345_cov58-Phaeocystis_antarctica.AAC.1